VCVCVCVFSSCKSYAGCQGLVKPHVGKVKDLTTVDRKRVMKQRKFSFKKRTELRGLSPQMNYAHRASAACRPS
jgi:hypothetical protein